MISIREVNPWKKKFAFFPVTFLTDEPKFVRIWWESYYRRNKPFATAWEIKTADGQLRGIRPWPYDDSL